MATEFPQKDEEYEASVRFWINLWDRVDQFSRKSFGWSYPWIGTGSLWIKDGNPIFSAISPGLLREVRQVVNPQPVIRVECPGLMYVP